MEAQELQWQDLNGIDEADALILAIYPGVDSAGSWTELGYALARGKPVCATVIFSPDPGLSKEDLDWIDSKIFLAHPDVNVSYSPRDLFADIRSISRD